MSKNTVKKMGFGSIVLLGINAIIGTGIFGLPGEAYSQVGPSSILVLGFCMLLAISIALCFAEAGSWFEENGGPYLYAKEAFGDFVGFQVGVMKWAVSMIAWATMANFFAVVLSSIWPQAADPFIKNVIIGILLVGLGCVSLMGVESSKILNNIMTIGKLVPLVFFIAIGIFFIKGGNFQPFVIIPEGKTTSSAFVAVAISLFYAFTGFESLAVAANDMENPRKNVPRALTVVMLIVSLVYVLVLAVSIGILGNDLSGAANPVADAAKVIMGSAGGYIITIGTIISVGGINIASSIFTPRSGAALAEQGLMPAFLGKTNSKGVPYVSVIVSVIGTLLIAWSGSFTTLSQISVVSRFIQYIPTCLAVLILRKKFAGKEVSFKIPGGAFVPVFATLLSVVLLVKAGIDAPMKIVWGLGGMILVVPLYFYMTKVYNKRNKDNKLSA
ncbi:APC family permease [Terrisporobacter mayombei]|uniref:Transporter n=1 Tax=Terrisporobacter mayombei TaxID=1541 RepID=A0ABY9Q7H6_9FIRM|nr:APC family permease [Terrisporobacter mayombei]MCC3868699.1 APC family permease [Terrisporobacter mayombei]WMT83175.1 putative transporter [Terrisporobacter mayombei]